MTVYLLHSDTPLGTRGGHEARHYLGWVPNQPGALDHRLGEHRFGNPQAKIVEAFGDDRRDLEVVAIWPGADQHEERQLKKGGHFDQYCWRCHMAEGFRLNLKLAENLACLQK